MPVLTAEQLIYVGWVVVGLFATTFAVILLTLLQRLAHIRTEKQLSVFFKTWRPFLERSLSGLSVKAPDLQQKDLIVFLKLWNDFYENSSSELQSKLQELTRTLDIDSRIQGLSQVSAFPERLITIIAVGNLKMGSKWEMLKIIVMEPDPVISLAAAHAMVQINSAAAMAFLASYIASRLDWSRVRLAALLKLAGADTASEPLAKAFSMCPSKDLQRLIGFLRFVHPDTALRVSNECLRKIQDERVIVDCLEILGMIHTNESRLIVRKYLKHDFEEVRAAAASALGRIGTDEDEPKLAPLLEDADFSVRQQAAEAIAALPAMTFETMGKFLKGEDCSTLVVDAMAEMNLRIKV